MGERQKGYFMAKILGIEVGNSFTRICELDYKTKNPKLYKYITIPTPNGVINDGFLQENVEFSLAIKKALSDNKITTKQAIFTVSSNKIVTREVMIPAVKTNQVGTYIRANATDYFPIDLALYELAHVVLGTVKTEGEADKLRVMVIAASKELIAGYTALAASCGLRIQHVDYAGNSVFQLMKEECGSETALVVKVEEDSTIASVICNGELVLQRNLASGIDRAVNMMVQAPEYPENTYEAAFQTMCRRACVKVVLNERTRMIEPESNAGESEAVTEARKRITDTFAQLISNVARVIELHNTKNRNNPITSIILVGLGADVIGLNKLFTNELGIQTQVIKNLGGVSYFHSVDQESIAKYVASIGATFEPVNLLGDGSKAKVKTTVDYGKLSVLIGVLAVVVIGGMCALAIPPYLEEQQTEKDLKEKITLYEQAEKLYNSYNGLKSLDEEVAMQYRITEHPNNNLIAFLSEMETKLPSDSYLQELVSNGESAALKVRASSYEEAAKIIETFRSFDSVRDVVTTALTEVYTEATEDAEEDYYVEFDVVCYYLDAAVEQEK